MADPNLSRHGGKRKWLPFPRKSKSKGPAPNPSLSSPPTHAQGVAAPSSSVSLAVETPANSSTAESALVTPTPPHRPAVQAIGDAQHPDTVDPAPAPKPLPEASATAPSEPAHTLHASLSTATKLTVKSTASAGWNGFKLVLGALKESADAFAPLKSAVGGLIALIEIVENVSNANADFEGLIIKASDIKTLLDDYTPSNASQQALDDVSVINGRIKQMLEEFELEQRPGRKLFARILNADEDQRVIKAITETLSQIHALFTSKTVRRIEADTNTLVKGLDDSASNATLAKLDPVLQARTPKDGDVPCMDNTRTQILEDIMNWARDPESEHILWLEGMAGMGKTTIAVSLRNKLIDEDLFGASFFCWRDEPDRRNVYRILPTLAHGLAQRDADFKSSITSAIANVVDIQDRSSLPKQFALLLHHPVRPTADGGTRPPVCVLDALDECGAAMDPDERNDTITHFLRALVEASKCCSMKFLITSRLETRINRVLEQSHSTRRIRLHEYLSKEDIKTYLSDKLSAWIDSRSLSRLVELSDNLFIYAATVQKNLNSTGDRKKRLLHFLQTQSGTRPMDKIDALYDFVIDNAFEGLEPFEIDLVMRVLATLPLLYEPLSVAGIGGLLAMDGSDICTYLQDLRSVLHVPSDEKKPASISAIHASFFDYLLDPNRAGRNVVQQFHAAHPERIHWSTTLHELQASQHLDLACHCLRILETKLKFNVTQCVSSHLPNRAQIDPGVISHDLSYACKYWVDHLLAAHQRMAVSTVLFPLDILERLDALLQNSFLYWIEVMSAMGAVSLASVLLRRLANCCENNVSKLWAFSSTLTWQKQTGNVASTIKAFIGDAHAFLAYLYQPISVSVPHIYLSALPFTPKQSRVSLAFSNLFEGALAPIGNNLDGLLETPASHMCLYGHRHCVSSVAFSPDGKRIVSGSDDKTVQVWDAETGEEMCAPLSGHEDYITSVAFSPDGKWIVSGSWDKTVRVWDADTGKETCAPLSGHEDYITSVAFSPDGKRIVSGSYDKTVRVWDAETGEETCAPLSGHERCVTSVTFSPDGKRIVSGSYDKTVRVWDADTGKETCAPLSGHERWVTSVAFWPDGKRIVSGSWDKTVRVWDADTGEETCAPLSGHEDYITSVAFSPDGKWIVSGSWDKTVRVWDADTGKETCAPLSGHEDYITSVAFSPDGKWIVSGSWDKTVRVWDADTGKETCAPLSGHEDYITSVAFSPDGKRIVSGSDDKTVRVWDAETGEETCAPLSGHERCVTSVTFSPDGKRIVSGSYDNTVRVWDADTGEETCAPLSGYELGVTSVAFSPDGMQIVSGSYDNTVRVWDADTGEETCAPLRGHAASVSSVGFSPDGKQIVSGSYDKTVRVWDADTGKETCAPLSGHAAVVTSVAFSPDGKWIVSGSYDKTVRVWDADTGKETCAPLSGHEARVTSVAFSPDGKRIVSGSWDKTVRVWDADTGEETCAPLSGHEAVVTSVAFSPDGKWIASGWDDKTIRVWNAETDECADSVPKSSRSASAKFLHTHGVPEAGETLMRTDGWIVGPNDELLLYIPYDLRLGLWSRQTRLIIGPKRQTILDMTRFVHGTEWTNCFTGESNVRAM